MIQIVDLLQQDEKALKTRVLELKRELLNLRLQNRSKELKNVSQISRVKRDVGRVKTALTLRCMKKGRED